MGAAIDAQASARAGTLPGTRSGTRSGVQQIVAGVDEAGRGPLAGPVVVAAVILDATRPISGLDDSKKLTEKRREALFEPIQERARAWAIEFVEPEEIDALNILHATMAGMARAVRALDVQPQLALIDGNRVPSGLPCEGRAVIGGDALESCISAASILAKVSRDRFMAAADANYPLYGFAKHKGYPTAAHLAALKQHGACPLHRRSFAPVKQVLGSATGSVVGSDVSSVLGPGQRSLL